MDIAEQEKDSPLGRDQHLSQGDLSSRSAQKVLGTASARPEDLRKAVNLPEELQVVTDDIRSLIPLPC